MMAKSMTVEPLYAVTFVTQSEPSRDYKIPLNGWRIFYDSEEFPYWRKNVFIKFHIFMNALNGLEKEISQVLTSENTRG